MILMGVAADHSLQSLYPLLLQIADHQRTISLVAAVNEHVFSVALQKGAICLSHIDKVHGQVGLVVLGLVLVLSGTARQGQQKDK